jgi:hypothetical protein
MSYNYQKIKALREMGISSDTPSYSDIIADRIEMHVFEGYCKNCEVKHKIGHNKPVVTVAKRRNRQIICDHCGHALRWKSRILRKDEIGKYAKAIVKSQI